MRIQSINPATEEVNKEFEAFTKDQVLDICKGSRKAFAEWEGLQLSERTSYIRKLADSLRSKKEDYARLITLEMGKPIKESLAEIEKCAWTCEVYADNAQGWLADETVGTEARKSLITFEPIGVILSIMPWNFPFWQALRFGIPALTLGNVSVLRHSNSVPMCSLAIEDAFRNAGFPENTFRAILTGHELVNKLIRTKFIDGVSLTGSTGAGREVAKVAAKNIKRFVLELGGSDPFIVLDDANIELACSKAREGRNISSGQSCIAAKRFIVVRSRAKEFTDRLVSLTKETVVGDPMDKNTDVGPLANMQQLIKLEEQVKDAVSKGAHAECGGNRLARKGYFYEPTVLTNIKDSMLVSKEEVFGPVSPIIIARNENDAIRIANSTRYGLGASIWTETREKGEEIARKIKAGTVYVNQIVRSDPRLPFGGIKESGIGRELSRYGMLEFANIKSIVIS